MHIPSWLRGKPAYKKLLCINAPCWGGWDGENVCWFPPCDWTPTVWPVGCSMPGRGAGGRTRSMHPPTIRKICSLGCYHTSIIIMTRSCMGMANTTYTIHRYSHWTGLLDSNISMTRMFLTYKIYLPVELSTGLYQHNRIAITNKPSCSVLLTPFHTLHANIKWKF